MIKYYNRQKSKDIILLSGWAMDHRIFSDLDIDYNYYVYEGFINAKTEEELLDLIKTNKGISILGWSLGGFVAYQIAIKMPQIFEHVILSAVRNKYDPEVVKKIKGFIEKSKAAYLTSFYKACYENCDKSKYLLFKDELLKYYLAETIVDDLFFGLDYMVNNEIGNNTLANSRVTIINGLKDTIVTDSKCGGLPSLGIDCGHMTILCNDISAILNNNHHHGKTRII